MEYLKQVFREFGFELSEKMQHDFEVYERMLVEWNGKMNLTAITAHEEVCVKHFLDSASLLLPDDVLAGKSFVGSEGNYHNSFFPDGASVCDVGTGAGFPGMVLKILRPDLKLTLVDSLKKRLTFLEAVSDALGQNNVFVHARGEEAARQPAHREQYDVVTARAVARLRELAEVCLPLVKVGGVFIPMKGGDCEAEVAEGKNAVGTVGGKILGQASFTLPPDMKRSIIFIKKRSQTSTVYPRLTAKMKKSPL